ncbi:hypothetical protein [Tsuneonella amylolytica]|uniref:hypothetical protein n=1 Tax=Tsuneonella amylolytica TaxID=2338327 RepID=UPI000EAA0A78|nr:hypothetical protein [Tsuneonella amylolytica]
MTGKLVQFGGSLIAIFALAWIALKLGLGGDARIRDEAHLRDLVDEALHGFDPVDIAIGRDGLSALARDGEGRIIVLRRHGSHFASRLLDRPARVERTAGTLTVDTGDRRFGEVALDLGTDAGVWAERLNAV